MTNLTRGHDQLEWVHAEIGSAEISLHLDYAKKRGDWVRTEQTYQGDWASSDEVFVAVEHPLQDLADQIEGWGWPAMVVQANIGTTELSAALRPVLGNVRLNINGSTVQL